MQEELFQTNPVTKYASFSHPDLINRCTVMEEEMARLVRENYQLRKVELTDSQIKLMLEEQLGELQHAQFGASSEKYKKSDKPKPEPKDPKPRVKKPSERYPNVPVREVRIDTNPTPNCGCCGQVMSDSGMTEDSEQLTVIPKKYEIIRQQRVKYCCDNCHGDLQTAKTPPRIVEGSTYSDEMILDVALSKYCDLIPIERYVAMAGRSGIMDIPPQSLIGCTHYLADFFVTVYLRLKSGVLGSRVLLADETPHRMLEGSEKKSWYLWGFSTADVCYFEIHDTRSGDVVSEILKYSKCEVLLTDVYSGYGRSVRECNPKRKAMGLPEIKNGHCNAHSRRYLFKARVSYKEAFWYLDQYVEIYRLNELAKGKPAEEVLQIRGEMRPYFEAMRDRAIQDLEKTPEKGKLAKALKYFLENYEGLTLFLTDPEVPIDNNGQERLLRSPVVGRKTWYGTHSERGAKTAAVLFSIVESCKLNDVNPREYFPHAVAQILAKQEPITPAEFKAHREAPS